ncbi:MAG: hypothetical protein LBI60_02355, partial [Bacteroidales bacterium]|nr:hypothetical protein [Bacteroidales bacterium]
MRAHSEILGKTTLGTFETALNQSAKEGHVQYDNYSKSKTGDEILYDGKKATITGEIRDKTGVTIANLQLADGTVIEDVDLSKVENPKRVNFNIEGKDVEFTVEAETGSYSSEAMNAEEAKKVNDNLSLAAGYTSEIIEETDDENPAQKNSRVVIRQRELEDVAGKEEKKLTVEEKKQQLTRDYVDDLKELNDYYQSLEENDPERKEVENGMIELKRNYDEAIKQTESTEETPAQTEEPAQTTESTPAQAAQTEEETAKKAFYEGLPKDKKGEIDFEQINDPAIYSEALRMEFGQEAEGILNGLLTDARKELKKADKKGNAIERARAKKAANEKLQFFGQAKAAFETSQGRSLASNKDVARDATPSNATDATPSDGVDDKGKPFVKASNGTTVFGEITNEQAMAMGTGVAAPIKLSEGNEDYGRTHINEREAQLKQNGYNSVEEFVEDVSKNYDEIRTGNLYTDNEGNEKETFLLVKKGDRGNVLYVELSPDGDFYTVNSGGVFKNSYINKRGLLWNASTEHSTSSAATQDFPTTQQKAESGAVSALSQNNPPSAGKDTQKSDTKRGKGKKRRKRSKEEREAKFSERLKAIERVIYELGAQDNVNVKILLGIAKGEYKFIWGGENNVHGLGKENGHLKQNDERKSYINILDNNGYTPESLAEEIMEELGMDDDYEIRNTVLDILQTVNSRRKALTALENMYGEEALENMYGEEALEAEQRRPPNPEGWEDMTKEEKENYIKSQPDYSPTELTTEEDVTDAKVPDSSTYVPFGSNPFEDEDVPFQRSAPKLQSISEGELSNLVSFLEETGLAKDVIVDEEGYNKEWENQKKKLSHKDGSVYGFVTKDGKIYINPKLLNANTPIHEYAHLWVSYVRENNKELWDRIKATVKSTPYWNNVNKDKNYKNKSEDDRIDEAFAMAVGDKGERVFHNNNMGKTFKERFKTLMNEFWDFIGSKLGIRDLTPEQIQNLSFDQLVNGALSDITSGKAIKAANASYYDFDVNAVTEANAQEMESIKEAAIANGTFMKAPNGKDSKLNEREWLQVRTGNFKQWFGDWENDPENASKVVDENGEPLVVWHNGTFGKGTENYVPNGAMHFGTHRAAEHRVKTTNRSGNKDKDKRSFTGVFLNIKNIEHQPDWITEKQWTSSISIAKERGFDGIDYKNKHEDIGSTSYIAFSPSQIKSATDNNGNFDETSDDVRFRFVGEQGAENLDRAEAREEYINRYEAGTDLKERLREDGNTARFTAHNAIILYHGSSAENIESIRKSGLQTQQFLSASKKGVMEHVSAKRQHNEIIEMSVDPRDISYSSGTNEYYAENGLELGEDGVWASPQRIKANRAKREAGTRMENLNVARQMETAEKDAKIIKQATGWERGADGKWKYEMPDATGKIDFAEFRENTSKEFNYQEEVDKLRNSEDEKAKEFIKLEDRRISAGWIFSSIDNGKLEKRWNELRRELNLFPPKLEYKLDEIYKDEELYKAYPFLRDVTVNYDSHTAGGSALGRKITMGISIQHDASAKSVLIHELQHLIQEHEGFAVGSNSKGEDYMKSAGETEARNASRRMDMTAEERRASLASETEDVAREDQIFIYDALGEKAMSEAVNLEAVNETFNEELQQQIDGKLPKGHVYKLGNPGNILQSTGFPNLPIELNADILLRKATVYGHNFDLSEIKNLPEAIQNPLAVFSYGDKTKAQNILIEVESKDGKKFIVGVSLNPNIKGKNIEVNSVRNVFPKDTHEWINWINQGKGLYFDKEKVLNFLDQQRINPADVAFGLPENQVQQENPKLSGSEFPKQQSNSADVGKRFNHAAKIVENFENPEISDEKNTSEETETDEDTRFQIVEETNKAKEKIEKAKKDFVDAVEKNDKAKLMTEKAAATVDMNKRFADYLEAAQLGFSEIGEIAEKQASKKASYKEDYQLRKEQALYDKKTAKAVRWVDEDLTVKKLQNFVIEKKGTLSDMSNAYEDKNHSSSRAQTKYDRYWNDCLLPLVDSYYQIKKSGGLSSVLPGEVFKKVDRKIDDNRKIDLYLQAKDIQEAKELGLADRGEKGFLEETGYFYDPYIDEFEKYVNKELVDSLNKNVKAATQFSLDQIYEGGLCDEETYKEFSKREYYVPQRGWHERELLEGMGEEM